MKNIIIDVQQRLSSLTNIKHIDENWGQLDYEQPPVKFPCVLTDIADVGYTQAGQGSQIAQGSIELTVATLKLTPTSHKSKNNNHETIDLINDIHQLIHQWATNHMTPLLRTKLERIDTPMGIKAYRIIYETSWREYKQQHTQTVQVQAKIKVER